MSPKLVALLSVAVIAAISVIATFAPSTFYFLKYIPYGDKVGHFFLFGVLALTFVSAMPGSRSPLYGALLAAIIVVTEEVIQVYAPTRSFSLLDMAASLSGVVVFAVVGHMYCAKVST